MYRIASAFIICLTLFLLSPLYSEQIVMNKWVPLRSDNSNEVRQIIKSEVEKQGNYSLEQEVKANRNAVEDEQRELDTGYKNAISDATREFNQASKRRNDLTTQFQNVSLDLESKETLKKTYLSTIESIDNQILRSNQEVKAQQDGLQKSLISEKQGEVLAVAIYTVGFRDSFLVLEGLADQASVAKIVKYMNTSIQSYTSIINETLSVDFIRSVEEGTALWTKDDPLKIMLKSDKQLGNTFLRLKRYDLYPFQNPKEKLVSSPGEAKSIQVAVITSKEEFEEFINKNGYSPDTISLAGSFARVNALINQTNQANTVADLSLKDQVRSFKERISAAKERISASQAEKANQLTLLNKLQQDMKQLARDRDVVQANKDAADRNFLQAQSTLHEIRRVRESIIIKAARTGVSVHGAADSSVEAIINKLAEVRNDAKTRHSSSTTEVTNYQVTAESSSSAITEAMIKGVRLVSFENEGEDQVRVTVAFRIMTSLDESDKGVKGAPTKQPVPARLVTTPPSVDEKERRKLEAEYKLLQKKLSDDMAAAREKEAREKEARDKEARAREAKYQTDLKRQQDDIDKKRIQLQEEERRANRIREEQRQAEAQERAEREMADRARERREKEARDREARDKAARDKAARDKVMPNFSF